MGTVAKALSLLNLFSMEQPEIGLSDVARLSGMNKATAYRLLSELQSQGIVEQVGPDRAYRLGPGVLRLAALREASVPLLTVAREVVRALSDETGETAHMSVIRGTRLIALTYAYSQAHATRVTMENATDLAFHATGSGLAVLAFSDPGFVNETLAQPLPAYTEETVTDSAAVRAALDAARLTGVAECRGLFEAEVHSHAAPVFGPDGKPLGALAVAAPYARMTNATAARIHAAVIAGTRELTHRTGGALPADYPTGAPT